MSFSQEHSQDTPSEQIHTETASKSTRNLSQGFTIIEFVVVIAIIFLLISLLIPGIQRMQAAARASQCKNNMKQLALALHNYHDAQRTFPPGYISIIGVKGSQLRNEWGWGAFLLPYVDQAPLFRHIDFNLSVSGHSSGEDEDVPSGGLGTLPLSQVVTTDIPVFRCTVDQSQSTQASTLPVGQNVPFAPSSYSAMTGIHWMSLPCATFVSKLNEPAPEITTPRCQPSNGAFFLNSRVRFDDLRDGVSQTIALGETSLRLDFPHTVPGDHGPELVGGTYWAGVTHPMAQDQVLTASMEGINQTNESGFSSGLNSYHQGGAHAAFFDGSVRFISDKVQSRPSPPYGILQHLSTIDENDLTVEF